MKKKVPVKRDTEAFKQLVSAMGCTPQLMPDSRYVVSDQEIIRRICTIDDLEQKDRGGRTLLHNASFYGRRSVVQHLIAQGANIHAPDQSGFTPLHCAVQGGHVDILGDLIQAGADGSAVTALGNNSLMLCSHRTSAELFRLLLKHGCDPQQKNNSGISPIQKFTAYPQITGLFSE